MNKFKQVYQFKIMLKGTKPPVWRRIQVPETYTFYDLHVAIQDAFGWTDTHLHEFTIQAPNRIWDVRIGIPDDEMGFDNEILEGWSHKISKYFTFEKMKALYVYDFGDYWEHKIELEGIFPKDESQSYPICLKGRRACPPEDCGGAWGYREICNGSHESQEEYQDFDPNAFDPKEVYFNDPKEQFKLNFKWEEHSEEWRFVP